jgi:hypothetical protein
MIEEVIEMVRNVNPQRAKHLSKLYKEVLREQKQSSET